MTARIRRWRCAWNAIGVAFVCAVLLVFSSSSRLSATPFATVTMDVRTGEILRSSNATARLHPASLTKMMTLYIAFEAVENGEISLDTRVRISQAAASQPPSRLGLRSGQTIAFRYLIRAAALRSANDAAVAIAEALEGSVANFATRMNRTARAMGMDRTHFRNPHGLTEEGHLSTARDMSTLGRQLYFDFPQYYNIFSRMSEDAGIATVRNTNRRFLDGYRGADGIKTGFTNAAGYNLTAMAERDGVRILVTVMGARSSNHRYEQIVAAMDRGFRDAPRRAAIRRPARPNYVRAPEDSGSGPAAGRVIRLQTAPTASRFPRARPTLPGEAPPAALIATLRNEIDEVIEEIREPDPVAPGSELVVSTDTTEEPEEADVATDAGASTAVAALDVSLIPAARPDALVEMATEVSRASNSSAVEPQVTALIDADTIEDDALVPPAEVTATLLDSTPLQFEHNPDAVAGVSVEDGRIVIPGLPPIAPDVAAAPVLPETQEPARLAAIAPSTDAPALQPIPMVTPTEGALQVGPDGRILWQDEELLTALEHEDPANPVLAPSIVLTTSGADEPAPPPPMPEIVTRVSTSGGRVWAVELGLYPSRFDAERVLLRLALSEAGTLGTGVRRVTPRSGRFAAEVHSLSQEEAALACTRLVARDHPCSVMDP